MLSSITMAMNAFNPDNYVPYEDNLFPRDNHNPETTLIHKDSFEKLLSPESKKAIDIINNMPESIFKNNMRQRNPAWYKIQEYMVKEYKYKWKDTDKVKKEITAWLKEN